MSVVPPLNKGVELEELLKAYFWDAGYFVVRGLPYRVAGEDVTDVDLWLYERPTASARRRLIVDIKNKKSPKAAERIIWAKGLEAALGVDGSIVATTDNRLSTRNLSKNLKVTLFDGVTIQKIQKNSQFFDDNIFRMDEFDSSVKAVDDSRGNSLWRDAILISRSSLLSGLGSYSANISLASSKFFAEQAVTAHPRSVQAEMAVRLFYLVSSFFSISLDYILSDLFFKSQDECRKAVIQAIRFGSSDFDEAFSSVTTAILLVKKYLRSPGASKVVEKSFFEDANNIPAEIIGDYASLRRGGNELFDLARELDRASVNSRLPSYDNLTIGAKSLLGAILDFHSISRDRLAAAWPS